MSLFKKKSTSGEVNWKLIVVGISGLALAFPIYAFITNGFWQSINEAFGITTGGNSSLTDANALIRVFSNVLSFIVIMALIFAPTKSLDSPIMGLSKIVAASIKGIKTDNIEAKKQMLTELLIFGSVLIIVLASYVFLINKMALAAQKGTIMSVLLSAIMVVAVMIGTSYAIKNLNALTDKAESGEMDDETRTRKKYIFTGLLIFIILAAIVAGSWAGNLVQSTATSNATLNSVLTSPDTLKN